MSCFHGCDAKFNLTIWVSIWSLIVFKLKFSYSNPWHRFSKTMEPDLALERSSVCAILLKKNLCFLWHRVSGMICFTDSILYYSEEGWLWCSWNASHPKERWDSYSQGRQGSGPRKLPDIKPRHLTVAPTPLSSIVWFWPVLNGGSPLLCNGGAMQSSFLCITVSLQRCRSVAVRAPMEVFVALPETNPPRNSLYCALTSIVRFLYHRPWYIMHIHTYAEQISDVEVNKIVW